jgi:hypothetical protein
MTHPGGRPRIFKSVEELQSKIDEYFDYCDNRIQQVYSKKLGEVIEIINPEPYTMAGLAYYMGIDRDTLLNYGKRDEYFGTVKKARDRVQMDVERRLMEDAPTGAIFNLKNNFGYKDRSEIDAKVENVTPILGGNTKDDISDVE